MSEPAEAAAPAERRDSPAKLLEEISAFLIDNDLEVNTANLTTAFHVASGSKPRLAMQVAQLASAGRSVTQSWLDDHPEHQSEVREIEMSRQLMTELDTILSQFARHTTAARSAANDYSCDLARHATALERAADRDDLVTRLISLTQCMAERTRMIEEELGTREKEARRLRRQVGQMKRDAEQDHLTGLANRRAFETRFTSECVKAAEENEALSIAFCDIDHFKHINDTHGHDTGDRVLKMIAKVLTRISNERCHVARHGGEEFVLLFRGKDTLEAKEALDGARETLFALRLVNRDTHEPIGHVTFSAGVADVFADADPRSALRRADEALYLAKKGGRNCVMVA
ncbi:GGDEF domain-containing protein [Altererythrobacter sp. B11]|uniref:GGDEF domain-containing protein n=1 Tax=Altererythrobacter sp. B11 TaxID=2060312 RepID=UPI000DC7353F|nr:GGDEF domain-containing protein [Altererythrobacter sp. B11]BBC72138.1 GGDEF domain-containing protein [Altererythrobacter sp. B11]